MISALVSLGLAAIPAADVDVDVAPLANSAAASSLAPSLARGADGEVYLSWTETESGRSRLLVARLAGEAWSEPREVASGADWFVNWADFPALAALADGTLLAHWLQKSSEGTYSYDVRFSLSSDVGRTWSAARVLHEDRTPTEHGFVSIVPLDAQRFAAIWLDGRGMAAVEEAEIGEHAGHGSMALYFRTITASGELGDEVRLDERTCECCQTALVRDADGALVAAWRDRSEREVRDVFVTRFEEGAWSPSLPASIDGWTTFQCPVNGPQLAAGADAVTLAWYTEGAGGGGRVLASRTTDRGRTFDEPVRLDDGDPIGRVDVVALEEGAVLVSWLERTSEGEAEWRLKRLDADGVSAEGRVATVTSSRRSGFLRMAPWTEGRVVLAWTEAGRVRTAVAKP